MKLGVSNLAWPDGEEERALALLAARGAAGVEVAPTRIAPWEDLTAARLGAFRGRCAASGLAVSSLQAIFFQRPEASLLGEAPGFEAMAEHVRRVAGIAQALGAQRAVFGAPKNRLRGTLAADAAMRLAVERLRRLGDIATLGGLILGIEPVPPAYGADFLNRACEVIELVQLTDHPAIRVHLDTACVGMARDDIAEAIAAAGSLLAHFHIAEPQLGPFEAPVCSHPAASAALRATGYKGWAVIEMRETPDSLRSVERALAYASACYG